MKSNGAYRAADETSKLERPSSKPEVWNAYARDTGAYLGVVVETLAVDARMRASKLYDHPYELIDVTKRPGG